MALALLLPLPLLLPLLQLLLLLTHLVCQGHPQNPLLFPSIVSRELFDLNRNLTDLICALSEFGEPNCRNSGPVLEF